MSKPPPAAPAVVWWIIWGALLFGVFVMGKFLSPIEGAALPWFLPAAPLVAGLALRFAVLPRFTSRAKAFPMFIAGLSLCEGCGVLATTLGGEHHTLFMSLSLVGIVLHMPTFLKRMSD